MEKVSGAAMTDTGMPSYMSSMINLADTEVILTLRLLPTMLRGYTGVCGHILRWAGLS